MGRQSDTGLDFRAEPVQRLPVAYTYAERHRGPSWIPGALLLGLLAAGGFWLLRHGTTGDGDGTLRIESEPSGAAVELDGSLRGLTPVTLTLVPGTYTVTVRFAGHVETIAASVVEGEQRIHHVRLPALPARYEAPQLGRLMVSTDPPGAAVTVDGVARGTSPLSIEGLTSGEHEVIVQHQGVTERRVAIVEPGGTASLLVPMGGDAPVGWISPRASIPLRVYQDGRAVGTSGSRIALPAGTHTLEFASDELGFRVRMPVTITAGQTAPAIVELPMATLDINADPWADVWVDGQPIGQTPIANLLQPIGPHQVTLRHPQLGEKIATVTVSLKEPARVAVNMRNR